MNNQKIGSAPDFTNAALIMLGVNMMWVFVAIWALYGFVPVLILAALLHHLITRFAARRSGPSDGDGRAA